MVLREGAEMEVNMSRLTVWPGALLYTYSSPECGEKSENFCTVNIGRDSSNIIHVLLK